MASIDPPYELKHRITGAIILVGTTIVLLSWVLKTPESLTRMPVSTPPVSSVEMTEPDEDGFVSRIVSDQSDPPRPAKPAKSKLSSPVKTPLLTPDLQPATQIARPATALNTVPSEKKMPVASARTADSRWIVRVGAFREKANVEQLVKRLKAMGYEPKQKPKKINDLTVIRVWVGPFSERKEANRVRSEINRKLNQNAFIAPDVK